MKLPGTLAKEFLAARFTANQAALVAAGATGIYGERAPETAVEPFVTVQMVYAVDVSPPTRGGTPTAKLGYQIVAWDQGDRDDRIDAIADAIDTALRGAAPVAVTGGAVLDCSPRGEVPAPLSIEGGQTYKRAGQTWELLVEVTS